MNHSVVNPVYDKLSRGERRFTGFAVASGGKE
jgi:hypothetical protein